jgi:hypothetical protein
MEILEAKQQNTETNKEPTTPAKTYHNKISEKYNSLKNKNIYPTNQGVNALIQNYATQKATPYNSEDMTI